MFIPQGERIPREVPGLSSERHTLIGRPVASGREHSSILSGDSEHNPGLFATRQVSPKCYLDVLIGINMVVSLEVIKKHQVQCALTSHQH